MTMSEQLERLARLRESGALTEAEFSAAKARLLSDSPSIGAGDARSLLQQLRRSRSDRVLGGVCGGLGHYTGVPSWAWRILFCLTMLTFGFGLLLYVLLWLFLPEDAGNTTG